VFFLCSPSSDNLSFVLIGISLGRFEKIAMFVLDQRNWLVFQAPVKADVWSLISLFEQENSP